MHTFLKLELGQNFKKILILIFTKLREPKIYLVFDIVVFRNYFLQPIIFFPHFIIYYIIFGIYFPKHNKQLLNFYFYEINHSSSYEK